MSLKIICRLIFCILILNPQLTHSQDSVNKPYNINLDEIAQDNFNSFAFLRNEIKDKRIVFIGEVRHSDSISASFLIPKITKHLIENEGFSVIVLEPGIHYEFTINQLLQDKMNFEEFHCAIMQGFTKGNTLPGSEINFFQMLQTLISNPNIKFNIAGVGIEYNSGFIDSLAEFVKEDCPNLLLTEEWLNFEKKTVFINTLKVVPSVYQAEEYYNLSFDLCNVFKKLSSNETKDLWAKMILSNANGLKFDVLTHLYGDNIYRKSSFRDSCMAENLDYFVNEVYKNEKIIVWASAHHISRNSWKINSSSRQEKKFRTMGDYFYTKYPNTFYSISFTEFTGFYGPYRKQPVPMKNKNSFEAHFNKKGYECCYVSLNNSTGEIEGFKTSAPYSLYTLLSKNKKAKWDEIYDAIIFINEMKPHGRYLCGPDQKLIYLYKDKLVK